MNQQQSKSSDPLSSQSRPVPAKASVPDAAFMALARVLGAIAVARARTQSGGSHAV